MFKKHAVLLAGLAAAGGVPYLTSNGGLPGFTSNNAEKPGIHDLDAPAPEGAGPHAASQPGSAGMTRAARTGGQDLAEVINFDVTPEWVMSRWPRVSAGLSDLHLHGYRVPLVSGTAANDLAGSLTYYFDQQQHVERITFHGSTGDPRKLVTLLTSRYSFLRQATSEPSQVLYQVRWNGKPKSELRLRPARIVRADSVYSRFEVEFTIARP